MTGASAPAKSRQRWDERDLVRRLLKAVETAERAVGVLVEEDPRDATRTAEEDGAGSLLRGKVVVETAMLLLCAQPVLGRDRRLRERAGALASRLVRHARRAEVLAAVCADPGLARDHAVAHILLGRLGYPDPDVDRLLASSLALGPGFGPERLPHRGLEQEWLARVWSADGTPARPRSRYLAESLLARPVDALAFGRLDFYAFTHAVIYASDLGERPPRLPRPAAAIAADAEAALAYGLDADDYDLTAEAALTWPMLRLAWSPAAAFAFRILAEAEDRLGFLPGSQLDPARYRRLTAEERSRYALATSYHTAYVTGFLCAAALREGRAPPAAVPPARCASGVGRAVLRLADGDGTAACWIEPFRALAPRRQDAVASLVLAIVLRRARTRGDLGTVRGALELALAHGLAGGPAPTQAAAFLRRARALDELLRRRDEDPSGRADAWRKAGGVTTANGSRRRTHRSAQPKRPAGAGECPRRREGEKFLGGEKLI